MKNSRNKIAVVVLLLMMVFVPIIGTSSNPSKSVLSDVILDEGIDTYGDETFDFLGADDQITVAASNDPSVDAETKFVVYPDGQVTVEGNLNFTDMDPEYPGPATSGFLNFTGNGESTQASAGLTITLPPEVRSEFPFNSTTASLLATYSDGVLNSVIDSTMILPPAYEKEYPFDATDGTITMTYSDGILNLEINGNTTLPPDATSQFPFNATDLIVVGTYAGNTLDGRITFDIEPKTPLEDINVDFSGNRTDLTFNGTMTVVFGFPLDDPVIKDEAHLNEIIDELESTVPGENGLVWNATGGLLNVTNLEIDYKLLDSWGATVKFKIDVHGDFVEALAYVMSGGRDYMLLYPVLNEAYQSTQSGSFDIRYSHDTRVAKIKLTFSYDLERLLEYIMTPPTGTTPYIMFSWSMQPAIYHGDVVFVEAVSDAGDVNADHDTGDIIAFRHPNYTKYTIIHRAISKTQVNSAWYFQTKGDDNPSPDYWKGNNTHDGMVSENCLVGKVVSRIPLLGHLLSYPYSLYNIPVPSLPYLQSTVALRMSLLKTQFSSVQSMSLQLSYSSADKRLDFQLTQVDNIEELADELALILPELLPPETPPEIISFVESLLNTTYASVDSASVSFMYENGVADYEATATIKGDLNAELNYLKDLSFQIMSFVVVGTPTIPWQVAFINETKIDVSNLKISAKLEETSFEGRIEGLTLLPPIDAINATHFKLERFFNLTAPEFPGQNQKLKKITIEGGRNATHIVTIIRPSTVPEPYLTEPPDSTDHAKSMVWLDQTLSNLKDLIFKTELRPTGTLTVETKPVSGEVFVNGTSWGLAPQSNFVDVGTYNVSFGPVAGYYTPTWQLVTVSENVEEIVTGAYESIVWIYGYVTDVETGAALAGATVAANGFSTTTNASGYYKIELVPGEYTLTVSASGYVSKSKIATATAEDATIVNFTLAVPGVVAEEITEPELVNATNPFIVDAIEEASASLIISEISDPVTIVVKNVTDLPVGVDPPPGTWEVLGNYVQITVNNTDITVNATIRIHYTPEQLEASGQDENTLQIHFWNAISGEWESIESHVNTEEYYVWAVIDHFSLFAILGQPSEGAAFPTELWFLAIAVIAIIAVTVVTVVYMRRRKPAVTSSS